MATLSKVREELAQTFLAALNQGQLPWRKCWSQALPVNAITGKTYRGINTLVLSYYGDRRGYTDTRWCTYNQAQEKGWQVRKGSKGVRVEYWACYDTKEKKLLSWDDVRRKLKADPDYEKNLQLRCRTYTVFNGEQIDGIPAPEQRPSTDIGTLREKRDTLIRNMGIGYQEGGVRAYYSPGMDTVTLPPEGTFDDTYSYMATFLHECGHATGHESRLNRNLTGGFGSDSYAREELRAEIASAFTAQSLGLQLTDEQLRYQTEQHTAYIQGWSKILQDSPEELFRAIKDAEAISDYLIEKGEFNMEQLFKTETVQQRKIMEWLVDQGITGADIAEVQLTGPAMVRLTNPAGQYMDVYCDGDYAVRILDVSEEREAELQQRFWDESNDPETQEWREELTADEAAMVEQWDLQTAKGFSQMAQAILDHNAGQSKDIQEKETEAVTPDTLAQQYPGFDSEQLKEIHTGITDGLAPEEIAVFAKPEFHATQMNALRYCVSCCDLRPDQLAVIANPAFGAVQMDIIRTGFEHGMSMEQVKSFAQPELTPNQMLDRYLELSHEMQYGPSQVLAPEKLSLEEFLGRQGLASPVDDYMLDKHRLPHGETQRQQVQRQRDAQASSEAYHTSREQAISEYRELVSQGKIVQPSDIDQKLITARGRSENEAVQAARRSLEKRGIDWITGGALAAPSQDMIEAVRHWESRNLALMPEDLSTAVAPETGKVTVRPGQCSLLMKRYREQCCPSGEQHITPEVQHRPDDPLAQAEWEFREMDNFLKKGGDIAELADWYEKDLAPDWD
ncbi:MAG: DUF1738 domain-containing protein [Oscillospiraceae bacterium]|nr:DUF1738 domain-containing protein [Oscillospiraceae bacterium]